MDLQVPSRSDVPLAHDRPSPTCPACGGLFRGSGTGTTLDILREDCANCQVLHAMIEPIKHLIPAGCCVRLRSRIEPTFTLYLTNDSTEIRTFDLALQTFAPSGQFA